ncbi:MAG: tandem-95 repeat protein [Richelia sp. RM1_1_1]|nr:tandem-95 repeat protein [Richelia sp. RM1_1_1]
MPVANNDTATTDEDNSVTINVLANDTDSDGDTLTITGVSGSTGSVTIDGDNIVYNPNGQFESLNAGETATDTFSYTVSDGNGLNDTATVTVTINGVDEVIGNENPVLATNNGLTVDEDAVGNITSTQLQVTDADNTAAEITYTITDVTDNGNLFLDGTQINLNDTFTQADINNNRLTYDHDGSETTSDSFNFTVTDGAGGSVGSSMFDITVNPVNDAPVANNDAATTNQNEAVTIAVAQLLANDTDVENDTLTITSVGNATNGSVALNGNNVVFNPDAGFSGAASFEYTLSDGSETDNATVSVMVNPLSSNEILGTPGRDMLTGDDANNIITGFQSRDMLTGNGGADQFVYTNIRDAGDIITDFEIGSDTIVLTQLLDSLGYTGSDAIGDGYVSFGSSRGDAFVQIDQDGAAGTDFISRPLVLLQGVTEENLSANAQNSFVF